ncbi:MAG: anaerobic ribonucleoside-triphosphate reductase activating protein [Solirubrobacterales bacterium]
MKIRLCGFTRESIVDGPGIRAVVFAQGCSKKCRGCHNPQTWDFSGGYEMDTESIIREIGATRLLRGVTFSGGEPFLQPHAFLEIARAVKLMGLDILVFTGNTFEELLVQAEKEPAIQELLGLTDILIDGPFVEEEKDLSLAFRGSRNQRILDLRASLAGGEPVMMPL